LWARATQGGGVGGGVYRGLALDRDEDWDWDRDRLGDRHQKSATHAAAN